MYEQSVVLKKVCFAQVNYADENGIEFQGENFVTHFKTEEGLAPAVSYSQFSIDPCSSSGTYAQVFSFL